MKICFVSKKPQKTDIANLQLAVQKETFVFVNKSGDQILSVGIGPKDKINLRKFILIARQIITAAKRNRIKKIFIDIAEFDFAGFELSPYETGRILAENFEMANFEFIKYKTNECEKIFVQEIYVKSDLGHDIKEGFEHGQIIGTMVNGSRILANTHGGEMTPQVLANEALQIARKNKRIRAKILNLAQMKKIKMGGIVGVSQGSCEEPKFIILEYFNGPKKQAPIVLIGKGVTFDSGGLNIKPADACSDMYMDMSGGAAVMHALEAAAKLKIKKNIVCLVPAAENMPSGTSYRPGDILKMMSGTTVEVINTDAEGRILLADAITFARRYKPKFVIDVATLTGAALVALGQRASAVFSNDKKLLDVLCHLGEKSGDYLWPLPLWEEYEDEIKGDFADISNVQKNHYGGAIIGATFLHKFAKHLNWAHIDIAPRITAIESDYLAKGSAGAAVRLLVRFLEKITV